jgi:prepilin signal peptidase PulO-like enzyme (type II secretory pathway)
METYYYILIVLVGLALGSFFNVVIFRFETGKSVVKGRSKCLKCGLVIRWFGLIPVFSYFILRGRCEKCNIGISPLYPIVEATTAVSLLLLFLNTPATSYLTMISAFVVVLLVLIIFIDIRYLIIPDKILILIAASIIVLRFNLNTTDFYRLFTVSLPNLLISAFGLTSFFAILYIVSKGKWIGLGDIKLIFLIGLLLGYPMGYLSIITAVWLAAIFSITLLALGRANAKTEIPFGSFLSAAAIIFIIFSNELQKISRYFY